MPVTIIIVTISILCGAGVILYSKITKKDETKTEKVIETIIETQLENSFNLPSGTLDGKMDFMVQPQDDNTEVKKD